MSVPTTYLQTCSMKIDGINKASQMIASHLEFSAIKITVNPDRNTYPPFQAKTIPEGYLLVTLEIPRDVCMPYFFGELRNALNQESSMMSHGERMK